MPMSTSRAVMVRTAGAVAGIGVVAGLLAAVPAQAAVGSPSGLQVTQRNSSTPILSWGRVGAATKYDIQVDDDPSFGSPEFATSTAQTRVVPTVHLRPGTNHWRVRAVSGKSPSSWSSSQFQVSPVDVPVPTHPVDGETLQQPEEPPLLRWNTSKGATSYVVEVDGDSDFIGAKKYETQTTSLVVPDPLATGDYFWRVTAVKGKGLNSEPSVARSFVISPLSRPVLVYPVDDIEQTVQDVVFDWKPVSGAKTYDLQVSTNESFNNPELTVENIQSTRYSPKHTLNNDQFWWRVRAVDLSGQSTPWTEARFSFKREWPDKPVAIYPTGTAGRPGQATPDKHYFEWTPVRHATHYVLQVADPNISNSDGDFTARLRCEVEVAGTTYAPRYGDPCSFDEGQTLWWRVIPIDLPYPKGLPGTRSEHQAFTWTAPAKGTFPGQFSTVTGLKVAMTGSGLVSSAKGCTSTPSTVVAGVYRKPSVCEGMSATPVFSWDRQPGVDFYRVWFAQDENFTTSEMPRVSKTDTANTMFTFRNKDDVKALPESQSGRPYYWYVQPCVLTSGRDVSCGPDPMSANPGLPGAAAFQKFSPAVRGLESSDPRGTDISFAWQDYLDTNRSVTSFGEPGIQAAQTYRIQVDNEPSFSAPLLDERTVDQATYTAPDRLYPEGTLYWRVQAIDAEGNRLTWSPAATLTKSTPPVQLRGPLGGAAVAGTAPFEWSAEAWANQYTVEVYRNNDTTFSSANRVFSTTTRNASYAWNKPIPASAQPYVWRVRRIDSDGNVGPWSATGRFLSTGQAPELLTPADGTRQSATGALFEWSDIPGAASYQLRISPDGGRSQTYKTVASAHAPTSLKTGSYTWDVVSLDASGQVLGTSATRSFTVDATAPKIVKVRPGKLKPKSKIRITFSERVTGLNKKSVKMKYQRNGKGKYKKFKVKVKTARKGKQVVVTPKGRFKPGKYKLVLDTKRIKDAAGNPLEAKTIQSSVR